MRFNVKEHLHAVDRSVSSLERDGQPARAFCQLSKDANAGPSPDASQHTGKKMSVRHFDWSGSAPGSET